MCDQVDSKDSRIEEYEKIKEISLTLCKKLSVSMSADIEPLNLYTTEEMENPKNLVIFTRFLDIHLNLLYEKALREYNREYNHTLRIQQRDQIAQQCEQIAQQREQIAQQREQIAQQREQIAQQREQIEKNQIKWPQRLRATVIYALSLTTSVVIMRKI